MIIEEEIKNSFEYRNFFRSKIKEEEKTNISLKETLKNALETRKFEIELYWKRTTYFWAFIASAFAGYFCVIQLPNFKELTIVVSLIGLLFSVGWYLANRGSKYWQKNWETHVDLLEDEEIGPLFGTILNPRKIRLCKITGEYPFSVSKINQIISFACILIWIYILYYSVSYTYEDISGLKYQDWISIICFGGIFLWIIVLFVRSSETSLSKDMKKAEKDNVQLLSRKK